MMGSLPPPSPPPRALSYSALDFFPSHGCPLLPASSLPPSPSPSPSGVVARSPGSPAVVARSGASPAFSGSRFWALGDEVDSASDSEGDALSVVEVALPAIRAPVRVRKFAPGGRGRPVASPVGSSGWQCVGRRRRKSGKCPPLSPARGILGSSPLGDAMAGASLDPPCVVAASALPLRAWLASTAARSPVGGVGGDGQTLALARSADVDGPRGLVGLSAPGLERIGPFGPPVLSSLVVFPPLPFVAPGQMVVASTPPLPPRPKCLVRPSWVWLGLAIYGCDVAPFPLS